ncbi:MAG: hypothetical protein Q9208_001270 [Pyrenodesmia sp. 3 TL-2023]
MSNQAGRPGAELLFCHQCENEWSGNTDELQCPRCESEFVEVVENDNDPREVRNADANNDAAARPDELPQHPLHHMNPWVRARPDMDDGNIEHVEWNPTPGLHFSRTSYRSSSPRGGFPGQPGNDPIGSLFQSMFEQHPGGARRNSPFPAPFSAPPHQAPWRQGHPHFPGAHQNQPGYGSRNTNTSTTRGWPAPNTGNDHLQEVMRALFQNVAPASGPNNPNNPNNGDPPITGFPGLHQFFASLLNPANAAHGDVVYSEEALDRIISQFMETQNGSSAPGPASAAAIEALPKKKVDKDMLGSDGKAECSVCMDNVELDDEVTVLPCQHWFHGECVGAWLKEHDTCPHCRQGIMPKDVPANEATGPRTPNQEPRTSLPLLSEGMAMPGGFHFRYQSSGGNRSSPPATFRSQRDLQTPSPRVERRRSSGSNGRNAGEGSSSGGGITGAIGGWMRNHLGGGGGGGGNRDRSPSSGSGR